MSYENAEIIERENDAILVVDRPSNTWFESYSGVGTNRRAKRVAMVLPDAETARNFLACEKEGVNAQSVTTRRNRTFDPVPSRLRGCIVLYHRYADRDDDGVLKAAFPPPPGIEVSFRWDARAQLYHLQAVTERNGALTTRTVALDPLDRDFAGIVSKTYARFLKTSPAPTQKPGIRCGKHVAAMISMLDDPAAAQYRHWLEGVRRLGLHDRSAADRLVIPGQQFGKDIRSLMLEPVHGRDEVVGTIAYAGGHSISPRRIVIAAQLPETAVHALPGRTADEVIGIPLLADVRIVKASPARSGTVKGTLEYDIEYPLVLMPEPDGTGTDDDKARKLLEANYADVSFDGTLTRTISRLSPGWLLHLVRTLRLGGVDGVDTGYLGDTDVTRMVLLGRRIQPHTPKEVSLHTLWRPGHARRREASIAGGAPPAPNL